MANYTKINVGNEGRVELHDKLALTGAEVSVNRLSAGAGVPFVHSHKNNEEIYGILDEGGEAAAPVLLIPAFRNCFFLQRQVQGKLLFSAQKRLFSRACSLFFVVTVGVLG